MVFRYEDSKIRFLIITLLKKKERVCSWNYSINYKVYLIQYKEYVHAKRYQ